VFTLGSILGTVLRSLEDCYHRRYPSLVVTLQLKDERAVARVSTFGQPIFLRSVRFELLGRGIEDSVTVNQMIAPHGQVDCAMPRKIVDDVVLTRDVSVTANYRTASGREAKSPAPVFNLVGGDGRIGKIADEGRYLSFADCPKCGTSVVFANRGVTTAEQLIQRKRTFEKDLHKTCPDHDSSRVKFWL